MSILVIALLIGSLATGFRYPGVLGSIIVMTYLMNTISGITSLGTISAILALAIAIVRSIVIKQRLEITTIDIAVCGMLFLFSATAVLVPDLERGADEAYHLLAYLIPAYLVGRLPTTSATAKARIHEFAWSLVIMGGVLSVLGLFVGRQHGIEGLSASTLQAVASSARYLVGDSSAVGLSQPLPYCIIAGVCLGLKEIVSRNYLTATAAIVSAAPSGYLALLNATRGVFVAVAAGLVAALFLSRKLRGQRIGAALLVTAALLTLTVYYSLFSHSTQVVLALDRLLPSSTYAYLTDPSAFGRIARFDAAIALFLSHPLFGVGVGGYGYWTQYDYPHNVLLEVAAQYGVVGIGLIAFLMWYTFKELSRRANWQVSPWASILISSLLIGGFAHQQLSFTLFMAKPIFVILGLIGGGSAYVRRARSSTIPFRHLSISARSVVPTRGRDKGILEQRGE